MPLERLPLSMMVRYTATMSAMRWVAGYLAVYGCGIALMVFLAKGGFRSMDAPYVVPSGIVMGALTGILVSRFGFRKNAEA